MKTSIFLTSFLSTNCSGSKPLTSPAIRAEKCVGSNRVMGPMPLWPAQSAAQFASVPIPSGDTSPTPAPTPRLLNPPPEGKLHDGPAAPMGLHLGDTRDADDCYFFLL